MGLVLLRTGTFENTAVIQWALGALYSGVTTLNQSKLVN